MSKQKYGIIAVLLFVCGGLSYFFIGNKEVKVSYKEVSVVRDTIEIMILSTGTVEPQNRLELKSPVAGRIEQILAREGETVQRGQIVAWMSSTERAALLDAARSAGSDEVKKWEQDYKPTPVIAPINGTIILRSVETGQTFGTSDSLFTLSDRLIVKAQVDETDIGSIDVSQAATITLDAFPSSPVPAKVDHVAFDATTVSNVTTYLVDVLPNEIPKFMKSGMTANVSFFTSRAENVLVAPTTALTNREQEKGVLVKTENGHVFRPVIIGVNDGKKFEIKEGLMENEIVLVPEMSQDSDNKGTNPFGPNMRRKK